MNKGFTLLELLITVSIVAILLAVGVPSYQTLVQNNNLDTRKSVLMQHLALARSEAVERKRKVTICGARNPQATTPDCRNNDWGDKGWVIFEDNPSAGGSQGEYDSAVDKIIHRFIPASTSITIATSNPIRKFITFSPDGTANNQGTFTLRDNRESANCSATATSKAGRRCVIVSKTGRVRAN